MNTTCGCKEYVDNASHVRGLAVVYDDYEAQIHHHPVDEEYDIVYGTTRLHIGGVETIVSAPYKVWIPAGVPHTMKPVSRFCIMRYYFPQGPIKDIPYTWLESRL